jgi:hypothetical protein
MADQTTGQATDRFTRRAKQGERVWVRINNVRADKREQFEDFLENVLAPAAAQQLAPAYPMTRFLYPTEPNEDGSYTYVFLMDPVVEGVDYHIGRLLEQVYGKERTAELDKLWSECVIGQQSGYTLTQSRI